MLRESDGLMDKRRKILFVISTLKGGGAERALCNITLAMPDHVEVDILVNSVSDMDYPHKGNVMSINVPVKNSLSLLYHARVFIKRIYMLRRLKKKNGYDACISFMDSANAANIFSGKKYCKTILSVRNTLSQSRSWKYKYIVGSVAKFFYPLADQIVALSRGTETDLVENFGLPKEKVMTIYNGYDIDGIKRKASERSSIDIDHDAFHFINIGRFHEQKGQWHLIRAFRRVVEKHPESRLILCGKGPYEPMLNKMSKELGIKDKVIFAGFQKNPFAVASKCNAFVFPSLYEGFGNVLIENMACGLPIIAADFRYGAREVLAPDTDFKRQCKDDLEYAEYGIITPVCSGNKLESGSSLEKAEILLSKAMIQLLEDKRLREKYAGKSVERAKDFAIEKAVQEWLAIC